MSGKDLSRYFEVNEIRSPNRWTAGAQSIILGLDMGTSTTTIVDAAAILSAIWGKNALRREMGLPLWPVRETFEHELRQAHWRLHVEKHFVEVRGEILARQRAKLGPEWPSSWGGRMGLSIMVQRALDASFRKS